jgi:small-conductance mechanosensitive channel
MTTRDTLLMTQEGNHLTLPNATVFKTSILNFTRNPLRRFDVPVGVGTDVDLREAVRLGVQVLCEMKGVVEDPAPFARVESLGDSNVTVRFYAWIDQREADFSKVHSEAVRRIKTTMDEHEIEMPVPIQEVVLRRPGQRRAPMVPENAREVEVDVAPEDHIERQVEEDISRSGEEDLLDDRAE